MSLGPKQMPGDLERVFWQSHSVDLENRVLDSVDELKALFPPTAHFSEVSMVEDNKHYLVYGRFVKADQPHRLPFVAYHCKKCQKIVVGMPELKDDTSIEMGMPLAGREGYDLYCHNCHTHLKDFTWKQS